MTKRDFIKRTGVLLDWKLSTDFDISKLKDLKENTNTDDVTDFAKRVFDTLRLEDVFRELGLEIPDFDELEDDDLNENKGVLRNTKYDKSIYKWF